MLYWLHCNQAVGFKSFSANSSCDFGQSWTSVTAIPVLCSPSSVKMQAHSLSQNLSLTTCTKFLSQAPEPADFWLMMGCMQRSCPVNPFYLLHENSCDFWELAFVRGKGLHTMLCAVWHMQVHHAHCRCKMLPFQYFEQLLSLHNHTHCLQSTCVCMCVPGRTCPAYMLSTIEATEHCMQGTCSCGVSNAGLRGVALFWRHTGQDWLICIDGSKCARLLCFQCKCHLSTTRMSKTETTCINRKYALPISTEQSLSAATSIKHHNTWHYMTFCYMKSCRCHKPFIW